MWRGLTRGSTCARSTPPGPRPGWATSTWSVSSSELPTHWLAVQYRWQQNFLAKIAKFQNWEIIQKLRKYQNFEFSIFDSSNQTCLQSPLASWTASAHPTWCRRRGPTWPWSAWRPAAPSPTWSGVAKIPEKSPSTRTQQVSCLVITTSHRFIREFKRPESCRQGLRGWNYCQSKGRTNPSQAAN